MIRYICRLSNFMQSSNQVVYRQSSKSVQIGHIETDRQIVHNHQKCELKCQGDFPVKQLSCSYCQILVVRQSTSNHQANIILNLHSKMTKNMPPPPTNLNMPRTTPSHPEFFFYFLDPRMYCIYNMLSGILIVFHLSVTFN